MFKKNPAPGFVQENMRLYRGARRMTGPYNPEHTYFFTNSKEGARLFRDRAAETGSDIADLLYLDLPAAEAQRYAVGKTLAGFREATEYTVPGSVAQRAQAIQFGREPALVKAVMRSGASESAAGTGLISKLVRGSRRMLSHL